MIQPFLKDELEDRKTRKLLKHIYECKQCHDEMRTEYLMYEGLKRLETGENFDLNREFEDKLIEAEEENQNIFISRIVTNTICAGMLLFTLFVLLIGTFGGF